MSCKCTVCSIEVHKACYLDDFDDEDTEWE